MASHYVYRIDRPSTGEYYIGIRTCKCHPADDTYMGSGTLLKVKMAGRQSEFKKTILVIVQTRREALRIEEALVGPAQVAERTCMNLREGGEGPPAMGSMATQPKSISHKDRIRKALTGKMTQEHRDKIAAANRRRAGSTHSDTTKAKISNSLRGNTNSRSKTREP